MELLPQRSRPSIAWSSALERSEASGIPGRALLTATLTPLLARSFCKWKHTQTHLLEGHKYSENSSASFSFQTHTHAHTQNLGSVCVPSFLPHCFLFCVVIIIIKLQSLGSGTRLIETFLLDVIYRYK